MFRTGSPTNCCAGFCATTISLCVFALPLLAHAQIRITEVMYDPPGSDDKQEWLELYNDGDTSVDLTKWTFSDGSSATKHGFNAPPKNGGVGSLTLQPGGYLVIADDATTFLSAFPSIANVIDSTMSLPDPNSGVSVTVTLYDVDKNTADTFVYVGGSNADNKGDSVQRSNSGIIPAAPTPAMANAQVADVSDTETTSVPSDTNTQTQSAQTTSAPVSSYVPPPLQTLFADAGADRIEIAGADIAFRGRAYTRDQTIVGDVRYHWNFGDGSTAEGEAVLHHYNFPGRYAVSLTVAQDTNTGTDHVVVTAEPARMAFATYPDGSAEIKNLAGRDLDLSRWIVQSGLRQFFIPEDTLILASASLRIPQQTLGFWSNGDTELAYPNGVLALRSGESVGTAVESASGLVNPVPAVSAPAVTVPIRTVSAYKPPSTIAPVAQQDNVPELEPIDATSTTTAQTASVVQALPMGSPWLWGAAGIAVTGAAASFVVRVKRKEEWEIEDAAETE